MKSRFTTLDILAVVSEIRSTCIGLRVSNVYDINNKTYLVRMSKSDCKRTVLFESGIRLHTTEFDWPKNITPSGFSMKLRKHIKNKRLECVELIGVDRIVRLQFGTGEWAFHLIVELYDRGNALLTDCNYTIVHLLRPRTDRTDQSRIVTAELYPLEKARQPKVWTEEEVETLWNESVGKGKGQLVRSITGAFAYGGALLEHCLLTACGLTLKSLESAGSWQQLFTAFQLADKLAESMTNVGNVKAIVTTKPTEKSTLKEASRSDAAAAADADYSDVDFLEFHPLELRQIEGGDRIEFDNFNKAVDQFFLKMESQRLDQLALQQEKAALKKLENIKVDHQKRVRELEEAQITDREKGELLQVNLPAVEKALLVINSALANQLDWDEVTQLVEEAKAQGDPVASLIEQLRLDKNAVVLRLSDPFDEDGAGHSIEIDLGVTAYGNVKRYFDMKKQSAAKEAKTKQASDKALKAADRKTHEMLKQARKTTAIVKLRKPHWFEKFYWFISSENYLVIGGRDQQQNELVVKRHMQSGDLYVHADLHGASSVVVKNPSGRPVPPKTLNEAAHMAVVYSNAWSAKVVSNAWWVHNHQVSKVAPTGEYLTTGSFMIRGKKNFLPPVQLVFGYGFLFKIDEESAPRHRGERRAVDIVDESVATKEEAEAGGAKEAPVVPDELEFAPEEEEDDEDEEAVDGVKESAKAGIRYEYGADGTFQVAKQTSREDSVEQKQQDDEKERRLRVDSVASSTGSEAAGRRKLTARERRLAKKGKSADATASVVDSVADLEEVELEIEQREEDEEDEEEKDEEEKGDSNEQAVSELQRSISAVSCATTATSVSSGGSVRQQQQQQQQPKRGQRSKQKKMKKKYKDQDDEDRELVMQLLQSDGKRQKQLQREQLEKQQQLKELQQQRLQQQQQRMQQNQKQKQQQQQKQPRLNMDRPGDIVEADNMHNPHKQQQQQRQNEDPREEEEEEEEEEVVDVDDAQSALDTLTGQPTPDDILLFAVPVCAPYQTMAAYKFKVKLTPGAAKKGKAVKTALAMFCNDRACGNRERDLLKAVKDNELCANLPGKVKLSLPQAARQAAKR